MNSQEEKIIEFLKKHGPALPTEIKTVLGLDLILTGAILSDMVSRGLIKISHGKIGGSNLYYLPGQEEKLERIFESLKPPEKEVFKLLKEKKILNNNELTPLQQVAIKRIPDFAKPLVVNYKDKTYTFWKWHLISNEEAKKIIEDKLKELNKELNQSNETSKEDDKTTKSEIYEEIKKEKKEKEGKAGFENIVNKNEEIITINETKSIEVKEKIEQKEKSIFSKINISEEKKEENIFGTLKISKKEKLKELLETKNIILDKVLLNSKGYFIGIAKLIHNIDFEIVLGFHEKRKVTENDLLLFYGYTKYFDKSGLFVFINEFNNKAYEILKKMNIKVYSLKYNKFIK